MKYWLFFFISSISLAQETRVKIAVIDSGLIKHPEINDYICSEGHREFSGTGMLDRDGHGTNIAFTIVKGLDPTKVCLVIFKVYDQGQITPFALKYSNHTLFKKIFQLVLREHIQYVNLSMGGAIPFPDEKLEIKAALDNGVKIVLSAGNKGINLDKNCNIFPACYFPQGYKNLYVVGNKKDKVLQNNSNYGSIVNRYENGNQVVGGYSEEGKLFIRSGTSQAAAIFSNRLISEEVK